MKTLFHLSLLVALLLALPGCVSSSEPVAPPPRGTVVATLPVGYHTQLAHGVTYYSNNGVYYRAHPHGYVVTNKPRN